MSIDTLDKDEIIQFSKLADDWWNEEGSMSFLHSMSETRTRYIKDSVIKNFKIAKKKHVLEDLKILDIGCGGGIASEPLSRMGAKLTSIDESKKLINIAKIHAKAMRLDIKYKHSNIEEILKNKKKYDVVLALELLEHVKNVSYFCEVLSKLIKPNGIIIISTINRSILSKMIVIKFAEDILKKIPSGTHNYKKFIRPIEIKNYFKSTGLNMYDLRGMVWDPIRSWRLSYNTSINYIVTFKK
jgi:2-polyprenyl-6-hydroxyphenyl methylase/3-demethylubiquinone-9 3-methyltransferase|tara:strand:- start:1320 stop:2045 length:726 start_codon:yes stop_codon:yes gene_type:complete